MPGTKISEVFCIQYVKDDNKSLFDRTKLSLRNSGYSEYQYYPFTQSAKNHEFEHYPKGLNPNLNEILNDAMDASSSDYKGQYELAKEFMDKFDSLVKEIEEKEKENDNER